MTWNNIKLETVTPIHIGNGEIYTFLDYFVENREANVLNIDAIFEIIGSKSNSEDAIEAINNLSLDIEKNIVRNNVINIKSFFEKYNIVVNNFVVKKIKTDVELSRSVQVKQFINQNRKCYLPGSSIKGAIRTAYFFDYFAKNINDLVSVLNSTINNNRNNNRIFSALNEIWIKNITGSDLSTYINDYSDRQHHPPVEQDFFRHLLVSDSEFIENKEMSIIETLRVHNYNKNKKSDREPLKIYLEVFDAKKTINFKIKVEDKFKEKMGYIKDIIQKINNLSTIVAEFEKNNPNNKKELKEFYEKLHEKIKIKSEEEVFMNLGFGGGYLPKTVYLLLWKYGKDLNLIKNLLPFRKEKEWKRNLVKEFCDFPMTRETYKGEPIGWVKLNFNSDK